MGERFEGWYSENKEDLRKDDIWRKSDVSYTQRLYGYFVGFEPVSGIDEEEIGYTYDAVQVLVYHDEDQKEVSSKEFVPWYDGDEVRNIEIPYSTQMKILNLIKEHPILEL